MDILEEYNIYFWHFANCNLENWSNYLYVNHNLQFEIFSEKIDIASIWFIILLYDFGGLD